MKHKVAELEGALLDASVAMAERLEWRFVEGRCCVPAGAIGGGWMPYEPSWQWPEGGPIIGRERIKLEPWDHDAEWQANGVWGPTALVAAMRAYVASKFGDEVDLPTCTPTESHS